MDPTARVVEWLFCYACDSAFELVGHGLTLCPCGRSSARIDGGVIELSGPARALAPVETVVRVAGGEWAPMPEDVFIRRVRPDSPRAA